MIKLTLNEGSSDELVNKEQRLCDMVQVVRFPAEVAHAASYARARP